MLKFINYVKIRCPIIGSTFLFMQLHSDGSHPLASEFRSPSSAAGSVFESDFLPMRFQSVRVENTATSGIGAHAKALSEHYGKNDFIHLSLHSFCNFCLANFSCNSIKIVIKLYKETSITL